MTTPLGDLHLTDEEACEQFLPYHICESKIQTTKNLLALAVKEGKHIKSGTFAYHTENGKTVLKIWWIPGRFTQYEQDFETLQDCKDELTGFYDVPSVGEINEYVSDSVVMTPADDYCEPDEPDSWLSLLGVI